MGFIKEHDVEIARYAKIIAVAVKSVDKKIKAWQKYRIEDGLVHAIIKLVDTADGDDELIDCCLDILDEIYRKRMLNDSAVSELINGIELL